MILTLNATSKWTCSLTDLKPHLMKLSHKTRIRVWIVTDLPSQITEADVEFMFFTGLTSIVSKTATWTRKEKHLVQSKSLKSYQSCIVCIYQINKHFLGSKMVCRAIIPQCGKLEPYYGCWVLGGRIWVSSCGDEAWQPVAADRGPDSPWRTSPWKAVWSEGPCAPPTRSNPQTESGLPEDMEIWRVVI